MCVYVCELHIFHAFHRSRSEKNKGKRLVCVGMSQMAEEGRCILILLVLFDRIFY